MRTKLIARLSLAALASAGAGAAFAHEAAAGPPFAWNFSPLLIELLLLAAALYALGVARLWRSAGYGRGISPAAVTLFACGWGVLVLALVSPLDALGGQLFSAHMMQHELLMVVGAPMLVLGRPLAAWAWSLSPAHLRVVRRLLQTPAWKGVWSTLTDPLSAWALHAAALWAWHLPQLFDGALSNEGLHIAQHASFLITALFFWWSVLGRDSRTFLNWGPAVASLFTTMLHTAALGTLLTLAPTPWYASYLSSASALGWDALQDQQLGGLVMWVPAGLVYVGTSLMLIARVLIRLRA